MDVYSEYQKSWGSCLLVIAEEDFSYSRDMMTRHPETLLIATSLHSEDDLRCWYGNRFDDNLQILRSAGTVHFLFEFNINRVHSISLLQGIETIGRNIRQRNDNMVIHMKITHIHIPFIRIGSGDLRNPDNWIAPTKEAVRVFCARMLHANLLGRACRLSWTMLQNQFQRMCELSFVPTVRLFLTDNYGEIIDRQTARDIESVYGTRFVLDHPNTEQNFSAVDWDRYIPLNEDGEQWLRRGVLFDRARTYRFILTSVC